ncbi:MAG: phosphoglycerate kinase [Candidatus Lokiarchaeota archaeon]|nr:phosphoglycerate kinase [Candidatus Lokiarchaeota archaeon]
MVEMNFKSIEDFDLTGKKVLLRVDINSSIDIENYSIREDPRIRAILPTLDRLKDSAVVLLAHQSRPGEKDFISLKLHADKIESYLPTKVQFIEDIFGEKAIQAIKELKPGKILLLDNIRKWDRENVESSIEEAEQTELIQKLSPYFDYFINDAFGAAHRAQPSLIGWPTLICGPLVKKELDMVNKLLNPEHPSIMIVGGAKADDKFKALKYNLEKGNLDKALIAGLTASMILLAKGVKLSETDTKLVKKYSDKLQGDILDVMQKFKAQIMLPVDIATEENGQRKEISIDQLNIIPYPIGDIGERTQKLYINAIKSAKTVVANGPPGIFEKEVFQKGTYRLIDAMNESDAYCVIGGGDMGAAAEMYGKTDNITISTGGGALLDILSGKKVPLLIALQSKPPK